MMLLLLLLASLASLLASLASAQYPLERLFLRQGVVQGKDESLVSSHVNYYIGYYGIPYAEPPTGELRFKDPVKHGGWQKTTSVFYASKHAPACPQWNVLEDRYEGDEDCLYLNVFVPKSRDPENQYVVMVFVHGGGYMIGGSEAYGVKPFMENQVIVVTIQYRLGVLGFLSTESDEAPGNAGLRDVVLALEWVQENIDEFGGDPTRVTVFGHSAGAAIVTLLLASPLAEGLFWAAIAQSGNAFCDWAVQEHPVYEAQQLAGHLNCPDDVEIVECLRNYSAEHLTRSNYEQTTYTFFPMRMAPVIDGKWRIDRPFLPEDPTEILRTDQSASIPLMTGVTSKEAIFVYQHLFLSHHDELQNEAELLELLPDFLDAITDDDTDGDELWEAVSNTYFLDVNFSNLKQVTEPLIEMAGDALFYSCHDEFVRARAAVSDQVYVYNLESAPRYNDDPQIVKMLKSLPNTSVGYSVSAVRGVNHGDELRFLFNLKGDADSGGRYTDLSQRLTRKWTDFAKTGDPTPAGSRGITFTKWPPFEVKTPHVYRFTDDFVLGRGLYRTKEVAMWRQLKRAAAKEQHQGTAPLNNCGAATGGDDRMSAFLVKPLVTAVGAALALSWTLLGTMLMGNTNNRCS